MQMEHTRHRNSTIELLRMVSMLMILFGHMIGQNGIIDSQIKNGTHLVWIIIECMLGSFSRIGTLVFMCITAWYLCERREFRDYSRKIFNVWLHCFFCVVGVTLTCILIYGASKDAIKYLIQAFFPIFGKSLWYASAYLILLFFVPYINEWTHSVSYKTVQRCTLMMTLVFVVVPSLLPISSFIDMSPHMMNVIFFILVYVVISCLKMGEIEKIKNNKNIIYTIALLSSVFKISIAVASHYLYGVPKMIVGFIGLKLIGDYNTVLSFICGISIFLCAVVSKESSFDFINYAARGVFGVYLIHQAPALVPHLWARIKIVSSCSNATAFFLLLRFGIIIYVLFLSADIILQKVLLKPLNEWMQKKQIINRLLNIIDYMYSDVKIDS